jgi:hypothetical protein
VTARTPQELADRLGQAAIALFEAYRILDDLGPKGIGQMSLLDVERAFKETRAQEDEARELARLAVEPSTKVELAFSSKTDGLWVASYTARTGRKYRVTIERETVRDEEIFKVYVGYVFYEEHFTLATAQERAAATVQRLDRLTSPKER